MNAVIRVAVVDDQPMIRDGFARAIQSQPDLNLVGLGANGLDAIELARRAQPDVIVMDIRMPDLDGITATRRILEDATPDRREPGRQRPRILVMTTFNLDEYVFEALRAGASGFLLKDAGPAGLLRAIRTLASGDALIDPAVTRALIGHFADRIRPARNHPPEQAALSRLTPREAEVLRLLARGLSNLEIASELVVTRETAKTYVSRILLKLGVRDRVQAVVYAYRSGIVTD
jgi:DNA-binding NarL/FixJ family response regulator